MNIKIKNENITAVFSPLAGAPLRWEGELQRAKCAAQPNKRPTELGR